MQTQGQVRFTAEISLTSETCILHYTPPPGADNHAAQVSTALWILSHLDASVPDYVSRFTAAFVKLYMAIQHEHKTGGMALAPTSG